MMRILVFLALLATPVWAAEAPPAKAAAPACQDQKPCPAKTKPGGFWSGKRVNGSVGFK